MSFKKPWNCFISIFTLITFKRILMERSDSEVLSHWKLPSITSLLVIDHMVFGVDWFRIRPAFNKNRKSLLSLLFFSLCANRSGVIFLYCCAWSLSAVVMACSIFSSNERERLLETFCFTFLTSWCVSSFFDSDISCTAFTASRRECSICFSTTESPSHFSFQNSGWFTGVCIFPILVQ